jgi:hypothetical protein
MLRAKHAFYIANNPWGDCGHKHHTVKAAATCQKRMQRKHQRSYDIYRIMPPNRFNQWFLWELIHFEVPRHAE